MPKKQDPSYIPGDNSSDSDSDFQQTMQEWTEYMLQFKMPTIGSSPPPPGHLAWSPSHSSLSEDVVAAQKAYADQKAAEDAKKAAAAAAKAAEPDYSDPVAVCAPPPLKPGEKFPFIPLLLAKKGEYTERIRCFMCHLEEATNINYIVRALCGHVFCLMCIYKYKAAMYKKQCVLCEYPYQNLVIMAAKQKFPGYPDVGAGKSTAAASSSSAAGSSAGDSQAGGSSAGTSQAGASQAGGSSADASQAGESSADTSQAGESSADASQAGESSAGKSSAGKSSK